MSNVSRRGFLVAAAACAAAAGLPSASASASVEDPPDVPTPAVTLPVTYTAAPAVCTPADNPAVQTSANGKLGTVSASVTMARLTDVVTLHYTITNVSDAPDTYTVSYTDQVTTLNSVETTIDLQAGQSQSGVMYGSLNHDFVFEVGLSDGTTLSLGPVGSLPDCKTTRRKYPRPVYQPHRRGHHTTP
jgi:hypothetical protein